MTWFVGFSIEGPSEAQIDAEDNRDGSCKAKYYPTVPGDYIIHITCNSEDIQVRVYSVITDQRRNLNLLCPHPQALALFFT